MSRDSDARVFLGRLPYRIRESDIERFFKGYGRIRDINVKTGFAFVVSTRFMCCISIYFSVVDVLDR
jgi:RNA recognition motif-containing protein